MTGDRLAPDEYRVIHGFLETRAGIRLGAGKEYLVSSRLARVLPKFGLAGFRDLARALRGGASMSLQTAVIDAMTTNETFWFRDTSHFQILVDTILPQLAPRRLRVWSAAASTGQEAYTTAFFLQDAQGQGRLPRGMQYEIVGTDISPTAIMAAKQAIYCGPSPDRGLTVEQKKRYFIERDGCLEVHSRYRNGVSFREFNLVRPFDALGRFDVVFCRNVLIYFAQDRKRDILERIAKRLNPGGFLFVGSTESMNGHTDLFEMHSFGGGLAYHVR